MLRYAASRALSTSAARAKNQDLIQQAFVKKIREYGEKGSNLINSSPEAQKALADELNRLAQKFQLAGADVVSKLPTNFENPKVESSVNQALEGQTLEQILAAVNKEKTAYVAQREAKKKEEEEKRRALGTPNK